ncbi:hypothetical protein GXM_08094 [Nostoc sphaeroides CCNUC1]|uniref:Uncharacterized protein n=1 Tax=Nostoc sphaeroides CCNUC1 TaxID=2653204 RepID=A0A5P8WDA3_9NOSO|nr:hypothetical protein GXM_08094 [Nostoc sphaeroides CCNUC1]
MSFKEQVTSFIPPIALNLNQNFATVRCPNEVNISVLKLGVIFNINNARMALKKALSYVE